jgi:hypothetical protein
MWLMLDDARLPLAGILVVLLVAGQVLWRIRRRRLVLRKRAEAVMRARHLAWVARQEQADRQRDAEKAWREQQAVQQQAREIADQITDGLARIRRMQDAAARESARESFSAVTAGAEGKRGTQATRSRGGAEKAGTPTDIELRGRVYGVVEVDREGWRRWRGSFDKEEYPRFWMGRKHGGWTSAYRLIYGWEQGLIPRGWTIDHACSEKDCLDHLECVSRAENPRRRHARERGELPTGHAGLVPPRRAA